MPVHTGSNHVCHSLSADHGWSIDSILQRFKEGFSSNFNLDPPVPQDSRPHASNHSGWKELETRRRWQQPKRHRKKAALIFCEVPGCGARFTVRQRLQSKFPDFLSLTILLFFSKIANPPIGRSYERHSHFDPRPVL